MPTIENVSKHDVERGHHVQYGGNTVLIRIMDPAVILNVPTYKFKSVHVFEFLDIERDDALFEDFGITEVQAKEIVDILKKALEEDDHVVVHCTMGVCRSGAVVEVAKAMGFQVHERYRQPNLAVKHALMKELGWTYNGLEEHYTVDPENELSNGTLWLPKQYRTTKE